MKNPTTKKKMCLKCGKKIDFNSSCPYCSESKRLEYNKSKRNYYRENREQLKILSSARWRKKRLEIIARDGGFCQRCFIKYGLINSNSLEVHHIKPRIKYPELIFTNSNLITLCKTCNIQLGMNGIDFKPRTIQTDEETDFTL